MKTAPVQTPRFDRSAVCVRGGSLFVVDSRLAVFAALASRWPCAKLDPLMFFVERYGTF